MKLQVDKNKLPIIDQFSEDGFVDCVFKISKLERQGNFFYFRLAAGYEGKKLGMNVSVYAGFKPGFDSGGNAIEGTFFHDSVCFISTGNESNRLLKALSSLYGLSPGKLKFIEKIPFAGVALHTEAFNIESDPIKIKLFANYQESCSNGDYFESYFNLDLANGFVFWNEKDQDYRNALVKGLNQNT